MTADPCFASFRGLGTTAVVGCTDPDRLEEAIGAVRAEIDACDRACSRFRDDSELSQVNSGAPIAVSELLCEAVSTALGAARATDGLVDPTVGQCVIDLGYDRSFELLRPDGTVVVTATHVPGWRHVEVDRTARRVRIPAGVRLDLGATAKALCADRASARAAQATGAGVLVSLGGDISVAGAAPADGWIVRVTDRSDADPLADVPGQTVAVRTGGLATSGITARQWSTGEVAAHHLVDPRTGRSATGPWRTATVAAASCVAANTASTAAIVLGAEAPGWLGARGHDARLVAVNGGVVRTGSWPAAEPETVLEAVGA